MYKNVNSINIYTAIILRVSYGYETWILALREDHRLRMFEKHSDLRGRKRREASEGCIMRRFINLYCTLINIRVVKKWRMRWADM
jgi:hypothetical protein